MFGIGLTDIIPRLLIWVIFGIIIGFLAARKHRNKWIWGIIGGFWFFWIPALLLLCFMSYLCPKCNKPMSNQAWKEKKCTECDWTAISS
jgi:hypothetical protein